MFTQQHYIKLQELINQMRLAARTNEEHKALSDFQWSLMKMLKKDNKKFNELLFIGGCGVIENVGD